MTEPVGQVERPAGGGLAGAIGPEAVAALLSIVVVVALLGARYAAVGGGAANPTPTPSSAATDVPTRTAPTFDASAARNLLIINQTLYRSGATLEGQLNPPPGVDVNVVRPTFGNMSPALVYGTDQATILGRTPTGEPVGNALIDVYKKLDEIIATTSNASSASPAWQKAATDVVATLKLLPPLDDQLTLLLAGPPPSPSVLESAGPSTAASPSAVASPSVVPPTPTVVPSTSPPSTAPPSLPASAPPSVAPTLPPGPNQIQNPGFEEGVGPPWKLVLAGPNAEATMTPDTTQHAPLGGGTQSARIDITDPTPSIAWVSLQQAGLTLDSGAYYRVTVFLSAAQPRDVVVAILSPTGSILGGGSRRAGIGPGWSKVTFDTSSIYQSNNASIAIEVGASPVTVWVDDVSVERLNSGAP